MDIPLTIQFDVVPNYYIIVEAAPTADRENPDATIVFDPPQENPHAFVITVPTDEPHIIIFYESVDGVVKGPVLSSFFQTSDNIYIPLIQKGAPNGVATLGADGKVPTGQLPPLAITETFVVATQAAMLALTAQVGDIAVRTDISQTFILQAEPATTLGNWIQLLNPGGTVLSVNTKTGAVVLTTTDISEGTNLYYTDTRARAAISAGTGIGYNAATGVITNTGAPATGGTGYVQNQMASAQVPGTFFIAGEGKLSILYTSAGTSVGGTANLKMCNGSPGALANVRWAQGMIAAEASGNVGSDYAIISYDNTGTQLAVPFIMARATGNVNLTGSITAAGGGFNSARELKTEIRDFTKSALDIILSVKVKEFKYKSDLSNNVIGFIAEEAPGEMLVDGQFSVDIYSTLGILVKGLQELDAKVDKWMKQHE